MTRHTITELDGKPIAGTGWYPSRRKAIEAARAAVVASEEALYVAVLDDISVVFTIARYDHAEVRYVDEVVERS